MCLCRNGLSEVARPNTCECSIRSSKPFADYFVRRMDINQYEITGLLFIDGNVFSQAADDTPYTS